LELQLALEKVTASISILQLVEIQSRSFGKRCVDESMIENTLHHLSRNFGVELPFGRQNDPSFVLCKMLEEIFAIDSTQFSLQFWEYLLAFNVVGKKRLKRMLQTMSYFYQF